LLSQTGKASSVFTPETPSKILKSPEPVFVQTLAAGNPDREKAKLSTNIFALNSRNPLLIKLPRRLSTPCPDKTFLVTSRPASQYWEHKSL
jgi:hypothetical protein